MQKFLGGLRYPAGKQQVLQRAVERGADARVMRALDCLPERAYDSPVSVSCELSRSERAALSE